MVASVGLVSLRSIWLMIDFATPDCSASSERERLYAFLSRWTVLPS